MEKLIKVSGDGIVTGYVRFKKVKPVKGYAEAKKRAAAHFSKITKARESANNSYAVVVRFYPVIFLIPLFLFGLIWGILQMSTQAVEKESPEYILTQAPTIKEVCDYAGMYIGVPGFKEMTVYSEDTHISVYNPADNQCALLYEIYYDNTIIGSSRLILPGKDEEIILNKKLSAGRYDIEIIAKGFSMDGNREYNSVSQKVELNVL